MCVDGVNIIETIEKGIIGQFLYKHITPELTNNYDYIIVMLDDMLSC